MAQQQIAKTKTDEIEIIPFGASQEEKFKLSCQIVRNYIAEPTSDGEVPDDRACTKFMMLCRSRKLNPFEGDAFMIGFRSRRTGKTEWSLITALSAFLKRAEVNNDYNGKESGIIFTPPVPCPSCGATGVIDQRVCNLCHGRCEVDELVGDYIPEKYLGEEIHLAGGWCRVYCKSKDKPEYQRLKLSTYNKNTSQWVQDPGGMICKCAEAAALRAAFPTTLGGLYVEAEGGMFGDRANAVVRPEFGKAVELKAIDAPITAREVVDPEPETDPAPQPIIAEPEPEPEPAPTPAPEPAPTPAPAPTPKPVEPAPKPVEAKKPEPKQAVGPKPQMPVKVNPVKAVNGLLTLSKIKPNQVLKWLQGIGACDDSVNSIEELALSSPDTIHMLIDQWSDISKRIIGDMSGGDQNND